MNKIHKTEIHGPWMGAINQIYTIVTNIIECIDNNKHIFVCGNFLNEIYSDNKTPISNIIDLPKINYFLYEKYKLIMVDVNDLQFQILNISYGNNDINIDITDSILEKYKYRDNIFLIPKKINLNLLKGDPLEGEPKKVFIKYMLNGYTFNDEYNEAYNELTEDIEYDFNIHNLNILTWGYTKENKALFDFIIQNISFNDTFKTAVDTYLAEHIDLNNKINVLHLRLEDDAINHWCSFNKIRPFEYKILMEEKYIELIRKNIKKSDKNIILSYSDNNEVMRYMKSNGYDIHFLPKNKLWGREINAVRDLCISKSCNNIFIGNYNPRLTEVNGSTFSYYISQNLQSNVKQVLIELEHIFNPEIIYFSE
jgi:hypothetical protein